MKHHKLNPFRFGSVVSGDHFCNRRNEIESLKRYVHDQYSVWLYSPRRYGKTSLIRKVFKELEGGVETIYFDLYNVRSLDDFSRKYARLIAENLFDWNHEVKSLMDKFTNYFKRLQPGITIDSGGTSNFTLGINQIKEQYDVETILDIPERIAKQSEKRICIAFDEFQEITRIEPFLINWMRSAFQSHKNISYIFLGSQQSLMETIFTKEESPFYEFALKMNIEPIANVELAKYIERKFSDAGLRINDSVIEMILEKSEGHPHFTQYFASVVFDLVRQGMDPHDDDFQSYWISLIIRSQSIIMQNIFDQLSNTQRQVLFALARIDEKEELFSSVVRDKYQLPVSSSIVAAIQSLVKKGLINKRDNRYTFVNPVFREWVLTLE
ncbi:MAG: ATP-binding protein [Bacteroidales bacterium]|nr:ATP-binding protein [Bacteroidales bacterium]